MVTVVTVSYNSGRFIRDTLDSVLAQDFADFEYIIADDASTDDTWEIISGYKDARIVAYRNEGNLGEYANRNKAIGLAKGRYLFFVDGDDILLTHGLGYFVRLAIRFPEAGMVIQKGYHNNVVFPALLEPAFMIRNHYFGEEDFLSSSFASNMFRTDVLRTCGMLSTCYKGGDNHIRVKIANRFPVLFIAGWVSWPRETPGSASSRISPALNLLEMFRYTRELLEEDGVISGEQKSNIVQALEYRIARFLLRNWYKGEDPAVRKLAEESGITMFNALERATRKMSGRDPLLDYSPVEPYRRDYLK